MPSSAHRTGIGSVRTGGRGAQRWGGPGREARKTAQQRLDQVMHQRETFVTNTSEAEAIFALLERH